MPTIKGTVVDESLTPLDGVLVRAHKLSTGELVGSDTTASSVSGDTLEENIALRLNLTTDFTDSSQYSHTMTVVGSPTIAAGWGAISGGALSGPAGAVNALTLAVADALETAITGRFCLEMWFATATSSGVRTFARCRDPGTSTTFLTMGHAYPAARIEVSGPGGTRVMNSADSSANSGITYHVALNCDAAGTLRVFLDGSVVASSTDTANPIVTSAGAIWEFGNVTGDEGLYLNDIRLTIGDERYPDTGFSVPTEVFSPGISLLGAYEITTADTDECYVVQLAPEGVGVPLRNHQILRVVPG